MGSKSSILLLFTAVCLSAQEIRIDLNNPLYKEGTLSTDEGGIIQTDTMRIQAHRMHYTDKEGKRFLTAEGNLLIVTQDKFFIGDSFTYDFATKEGELTNGVTHIENLFVDGKKILFHPDGTLSMLSAFVTTSDSDPPTWAVHAERTTIDEKTEVTANNVTLSLYNRQIFWLPTYSTVANEKYIEEPTYSYTLDWESGQGPLVLFRYHLLKTKTTNIFWRLEHRLTHGLKGGGTALEINHSTLDKKHSVEARNFYAYDTFYNDVKAKQFKHRYRAQGIYTGYSQEQKIELFARWDLLSDRYMRSDFPTQLFELSTLERTEAFIKARYDTAFTSLYIRPRINSFTGFQQELPTFKIAFKPYLLGKTGIVIENYCKLSYLDYVYAKELRSLVADFHSSRFETKQEIYRPFLIGPLQIKPHLGSDIIYYGDSPTHHPHLRVVGTYTLETSLPLWKKYEKGTHMVQPYAHYLGLAGPEVDTRKQYIFSVQDGFHKLNQLKLGILNNFTSTNSLFPNASVDLFSYQFFSTNSFSKTLPKIYCHLLFEYPRCAFGSSLAWNGEKNQPDHTNFYFGLTYNEYLAFSLELRHRGPYDWRKNRADDYILDVSHPLEELFHSPLSDPRTTFLAKWEIKIAPLWTIDISNHLGWRPEEPFYHESKIDFYTIFFNAWRLRFSYTRTVNDNSFSFGINLLK